MSPSQVLIIHRVKNYEAWKQVFDAAAPMRRQAGEQHYQLLCDAHDPCRVVHFSQWVSLAAARAFFESPELVALRERAGVEAPAFHYLHGLERGSL